MNKSPLCVLLLLASNVLAENAGEDGFRSAADWTVQVRTSVLRPFIQDEQGS